MKAGKGNLEHEHTIAVVGLKLLALLALIFLATNTASAHAGVALAFAAIVGVPTFNIKALRQEKADLVSRGKQILALAETAGRALTSSEASEHSEIVLKLEDLNRKIQAEEARMDQVRNGGAVADSFSGSGSFPGGGHSSGEPKLNAKIKPRTFEQLFGRAAALNNGGWGSFDEFLSAVHSGRHHPQLLASSMATEGVPADGGFSVPTQYVAAMLNASLENEIVRPRADVIPMATRTKIVNGFDISDSSSTLFGGFTGQWVAEGGEITAQNPKMRAVELDAKKLALLTEVTNELSLDGDTFEQRLGNALTQAVGWFFDNAFLTGTGAGQPLGVLNDPALISQTKETDQASSTIVYQNIAKMFSRLHPACMSNAVWVANVTALPQLMTTTITVGTGGSFVPLVTESNGNFTMLSRPLLFTEKLPALGSKGDILLADFSQYFIGIRKDMSIDKSTHVGFTRDTSHYRGILRADGCGKWSKSYKPKAGLNLSWCVTLEAR